MNIALAFTRIFFLIISIFFMTTYMVSIHTGNLITHIIIGVVSGIVFGLLLILFDTVFKKYNLRSFNIVVLGIFIGYLMGQGLLLILKAVLDISTASFVMQPQVLEIIKIAIFLFGIYLGTIFTLRSSDELYVSFPFVKFTPTAQKKKDIITDTSILSDSRVIDLANSGLLDKHLIIPRFIVKDLYAQTESKNEEEKSKAKKSLETIKTLEEIPGLEIRYNDTDFPEVQEQMEKLLRLARLLDANIITGDISKLKIASLEGIRVINIHSLSNALKPIMEAGETIKIKVQRAGKEENQGVGYLEDGTMVVINGGEEYIGQTIEAQVISVKHTMSGSGRIIFCNAMEESNFS